MLVASWMTLVNATVSNNSAGTTGGGLEILPVDQMAAIVAEREIQIGILAVPAEVAQATADRLVAAGVKGILNFAPASLIVPEKVALATVDLAVHLEQLAFRISAEQMGPVR